MKGPNDCRLTIDDLDPTWSEWHRDRLPDVHGMPDGARHWWTDRNGRSVDGFETGGSCGGCGWPPDEGGASRVIAREKTAIPTRG
jgi:hypothetical protein